MSLNRMTVARSGAKHLAKFVGRLNASPFGCQQEFQNISALVSTDEFSPQALRLIPLELAAAEADCESVRVICESMQNCLRKRRCCYEEHKDWRRAGPQKMPVSALSDIDPLTASFIIVGDVIDPAADGIAYRARTVGSRMAAIIPAFVPRVAS